MEYPIPVNNKSIIDLTEVVQIDLQKDCIMLHFKRDGSRMECKDKYALSVLRILDATTATEGMFVNAWLQLKEGK